MKLFAFYIGGRNGKSHIELHDFRVCAGARIEDCYDDLRKQWWGTKQSLHLDCWGALEQADGYDITLHNKPDSDEKGLKLWFLNLGGYDPAHFTELHSNVFVVAENEIKAKARALTQLAGWRAPHRDMQYEVESVINIHDLFRERLYIHLRPASEERPFRFECGYRPIGKG
jgi:hypothetical protein